MKNSNHVAFIGRHGGQPTSDNWDIVTAPLSMLALSHRCRAVSINGEKQMQKEYSATVIGTGIGYKISQDTHAFLTRRVFGETDAGAFGPSC